MSSPIASSNPKFGADRGPANAMTCDVEDYFQVSAFEPHISRDDWDALPHRVEQNVERILTIFEEAGIQGTFFTLGWIAERYPQAIRALVDAGHELASHGYSHRRVTSLSQEDFRADIRRTKTILEDIGGCEVIGYRAPSFSIRGANLWALDILQEEGYRYSSSIFPVKHDHYGMPEAPRFSFRHKEGGILEVPPTTVELNDRKLPCAGGGWFRLYPYYLSRWAFQRVNRRDKQPVVFYFHPWEVDPDQPRQSGLGFKTRFRHYVNLRRMESRLRRLGKDFRWDRMDRIFMETEVE